MEKIETISGNIRKNIDLVLSSIKEMEETETEGTVRRRRSCTTTPTPVKILQRTFVESAALHSHGLDSHSRALLCKSMTERESLGIIRACSAIPSPVMILQRTFVD